MQIRELQSICSPKASGGDPFAERTWWSLRKFAQYMLVHVILSNLYLYHALLHAWNVFNIPPLKDLVTTDGTVTTPFELFASSKPMVSHFRVFRCPCFTKKWTISVDGKPENNTKGTQQGIMGIHLGFSPTRKGLLLYVPSASPSTRGAPMISWATTIKKWLGV